MPNMWKVEFETMADMGKNRGRISLSNEVLDSSHCF